MNLYTRLKLPINCSDNEVVIDAYKREVSLWHPDKQLIHPNISIKDLSNAFVYITESLTVLENEEERIRYLESLYNNKPMEKHNQIIFDEAYSIFTNNFKGIIYSPSCIFHLFYINIYS